MRGRGRVFTKSGGRAGRSVRLRLFRARRASINTVRPLPRVVEEAPARRAASVGAATRGEHNREPFFDVLATLRKEQAPHLAAALLRGAGARLAPSSNDEVPWFAASTKVEDHDRALWCFEGSERTLYVPTIIEKGITKLDPRGYAFFAPESSDGQLNRGVGSRGTWVSLVKRRSWPTMRSRPPGRPTAAPRCETDPRSLRSRLRWRERRGDGRDGACSHLLELRRDAAARRAAVRRGGRVRARGSAGHGQVGDAREFVPGARGDGAERARRGPAGRGGARRGRQGRRDSGRRQGRRGPRRR